MASFALITEGITDQVVIETILQTHYSDILPDEVDVRILQPLRDATDVARQNDDTFGGWECVLEHCSFSDKILEAIAFNDFIVIQIDTDCSEHKNFNIPRTVNGVEKPVADMISDVKQLIIAKLGAQIYHAHSDKFIFAIAVHSTECWLLPSYVATEAHASRTLSCEHHLMRYLQKQDKEYKKDFPCYSLLVVPLRKTKNLIASQKLNESLNIFVSSLPTFTTFTT